MKRTMSKAIAVSGALVASGVCGVVISQSAPRKFAPEFSLPDGMSPEELANDPAKAQAMMAEWNAMNSPGEHHELLAYFAGEWETETKMWMDPSAPPMVAPGTASAETMLGGRFVRMTYETNLMGQVIEGEGFLGYDNVSGVYQSAWVDGMSTAMRWLTGHANRDGSVIALFGKMDEPQIGVRDRLIGYHFELVDADTYVFDVKDYHASPDGTTVVEVTFTRKE